MFKPVNRYLHVDIEQNKDNQTESGILLPDNFKPNEQRYVCAKVISVSDDSKFSEHITEGSIIIVDKSMIEEINFIDKSINVVLENYILGVVS
jgi:co-chaperonin GroES (HSP10)